MKKGPMTKLNRILLIITMLALMLILSGCRTRISNNTEVLSVYTDENGYMTEDYQYRRDDLGIPVAKKPYINLNKEDQESDDYDDEEFDYDGSDSSYDDEDLDDDENRDSDQRPSTTSPSTTTTRPSSSTGTTITRRPSTVVTRRPSTTTTTTTATVIFNANGGTIKNGNSKVSSISRSYKRGSALGTLPTATLSGYKLKGWYTQSGTKVNSKTKINYSTTLYAQWKKKSSKKTDPGKTDPEEDSDEYTVTWEYDSDVEFDGGEPKDLTVKDGDTYGDLPVARRKDYHFLGWHNGKKYVAAGDKVTSNQRLVAKFDSWENRYNKAKPSKGRNYEAEGSGVNGLIYGNNVKGDDEKYPKYVIVAIDGYNYEAAEEAAQKKRDEDESGRYAASTIIVIPSDATDSDNKLYYKLKLLSVMYDVSLDLNDAYEDTRATLGPDDIYIS